MFLWKCYIVNMTTQVLSKFKERPKTRLGWWVMGLGIALVLMGLFLGLFASLIRPALAKASSSAASPAFGLGLGMFVIVLCIAVLVTGLLALRKGERSWAVWLGVIPGLFFAFLFLAEFIFPH